DSSRYFYKEGYEERQKKGETQKQLSKEFLRQWLIGNGFQGKPGQRIPAMDDAIVEAVSKRYIELYEHITGLKFVASTDMADPEKSIEESVLKFLGEHTMA